MIELASLFFEKETTLNYLVVLSKLDIKFYPVRQFFRHFFF